MLLADFSAIHLSSKPVRVALNRSHPVQLIAENLNVIRGARVIIADVSFSVAAGESLLLTGPNGSGKTTLIRTIAGFLQPESGSVRLDGGDSELDLGTAMPLRRPSHRHEVEPDSCRQSRVLGRLSGRPRSARADAASALQPHSSASVSQPLADIPAGFLSAGQRRRLGLARRLG